MINQNEKHKPLIIIFRERLLGFSEHFIIDHYTFLNCFRAVLVGIVHEREIDLSGLEKVILNGKNDLRGKCREIIYKTIGQAPRIEQEIRKRNPALIHIHFGMDATRFLPISKRLKIPIVVTFHGVDATTTDEWKRRCNHPIFKKYVQQRHFLIAFANQFIAVSEFIKRKMVFQGFPADKIIVNYLGIDIKKFSFQHHTRQKPIILFVGRLCESKGCAYLIDAMQEISQRHADSHLVIVGDGPEKKYLEHYAQGRIHNYTFTGKQSHNKVIGWLQKASVFCVPSIETQTGASEGFGLVFIEAQAMGVPVVSFRTGGIPEAVIHGQTGFLCAAKDTKGLVNNILLLLNNNQLWNKFSSLAIKHVNDNFDIQKQTIKLEQIYKDLYHQKVCGIDH